MFTGLIESLGRVADVARVPGGYRLGLEAAFAEAAQLAAEAEDAADGALFGELVNRPLFHGLDDLFEPVNQRFVAVDDEIEDGVGDEVFG